MPELRGRFLRLTLISMVSNLTVPLVGLVDTAMLGHLEDIRFLAGVALATVLFDFLYWGFGVLRMATTGLTAQASGRGDAPAVVMVLARGLMIAAFLGGALLLLARPIAIVGFAVLSGDQAVEAAGRDYFAARIWGAPAVFANYVLLGWLLGRERPAAILIVTVFGNLANVALNLLFIVHLGWAARGAGLASMAGQYLALAVALALVMSSRSADGTKLISRDALPSFHAILERSSMRHFLALNRDIFIRTVCLIGSFAVFTNISSTFGAPILAANAILLRLLDLAAYLNDGAAFATESLAGSLVGGRRTFQLRRLLKLSLVFGQFLAWAFIVPLLLAPDLVLNLLTSHQEVITLARSSLMFLVPALFFGAFAYQYDGFFIGLTEGGILRRSMLMSALVFFLPLALAAWYFESNPLLWSALVTLNLARAATLWVASREWLQSNVSTIAGETST